MLLAALSIGAVPHTEPRETPEQVIRALVLAIYGNDVASYNRVTIPHPPLLPALNPA